MKIVLEMEFPGRTPTAAWAFLRRWAKQGVTSGALSFIEERMGERVLTAEVRLGGEKRIIKRTEGGHGENQIADRKIGKTE
jgi:hypothetical protein